MERVSPTIESYIALLDQHRFGESLPLDDEMRQWKCSCLCGWRSDSFEPNPGIATKLHTQHLAEVLYIYAATNPA